MQGLDPEVQAAIEDARKNIALRSGESIRNGHGPYRSNGYVTANRNGTHGYIDSEDLIAPGRKRMLEMSAEQARIVALTGDVLLGDPNCPCQNGDPNFHAQECQEADNYW